MKAKGLIFVISAPSGAGKTTVIKEFLRSHRRDFVLSVSVTTREPRKNEKNGRDYYFVTKDKFSRYIKAGKFIEYAKVLENYYGTLKHTVISSINKGKNVIMDIDIQGAKQITRRVKNCVTIFLMPPSFYELKKRLKNRRTESKKNMARRLALAKKELKERGKYDYIVVNKELREAVEAMETVYRLERAKLHKI
jgi:guanylate kinase